MRYCCRLRRLAELRSSLSPPTTLFWSLRGVFSAARELAAAAAAAYGRPRASLLVFPRFRSAFRPRLRGRTRRRRGVARLLGVIALCPALRAGVFGLLWAAGAPLLPAALISKVVFLAAFVSGALAPSLPHCATLHVVTRYAAGRPHSLTASAVAARLRRSGALGFSAACVLRPRVRRAATLPCRRGAAGLRYAHHWRRPRLCFRWHRLRFSSAMPPPAPPVTTPRWAPVGGDPPLRYGTHPTGAYARAPLAAASVLSPSVRRSVALRAPSRPRRAARGQPPRHNKKKPLTRLSFGLYGGGV